MLSASHVITETSDSGKIRAGKHSEIEETLIYT